MNEMNDNQLMKSVMAGDMGALGSLVERHRDRMVCFLYNFTGDYDFALDVAQESFVRVYLHAGTYREMASFTSWLYRIGLNLAIDEIRRRNRFRWIPFLRSDSKGRPCEITGLPVSEHPEQSILREERRTLTRNAILTLPRKYRSALLLRDMEGLSYEEVGKVLRCPVGTVKSRIRRARMLLKTKLEASLGKDVRKAAPRGIRAQAERTKLEEGWGP
jgi:RNA polymerase sigma-70 factor (ECF subfamily)